MFEAQTNVDENYDTGLATKNTFTLSKFNVTSFSDFACMIIAPPLLCMITLMIDLKTFDDINDIGDINQWIKEVSLLKYVLVNK